MGMEVDIPWVGGRYSMGKGSICHGYGVKMQWGRSRYTMGRVVKIPWVGGQYTIGRGAQYYMGREVDIPWVGGSKYHW